MGKEENAICYNTQMRRLRKIISVKDVEKEFISDVIIPRPNRDGGAKLTAGDMKSMIKHGSPYVLMENEEGTSFGRGWGN